MAMRSRIRRRSRRGRGAPRVRRCACQGAQAARADAKGKMDGSGGVLIGGAHDPAEKAADRMAAQALGGGPVTAAGGGGGAVHRECAKCAEEKEAKRDASPGATVASGVGSARASASASSAINGLGAGRPLAKSERSFFEPRFGRDFSNVRVHEDGAADKAANAIDARAFAYGDDIAFAKGERAKGGDRLMAHELAHVAQEGGSARRTVKSTKHCKDKKDGAPENVAAAIGAMDTQAKGLAMVAQLSLTLSSIQATTLPDAFATDSTTIAFYNWFGAPKKAKGGKFRSRFGGVFDHEHKAAAKDMQGVATRFGVAAKLLSGPIRYICAGGKNITIPGCKPHKCTASDKFTEWAFSCPNGQRRIAVCPPFWSNFSDAKSRGSVVVHEALHIALKLGSHSNAHSGRPSNPACYGSFMREAFSTPGAGSQCAATGDKPSAPPPGAKSILGP